MSAAARKGDKFKAMAQAAVSGPRPRSMTELMGEGQPPEPASQPAHYLPPTASRRDLRIQRNYRLPLAVADALAAFVEKEKRTKDPHFTETQAVIEALREYLTQNGMSV